MSGQLDEHFEARGTANQPESCPVCHADVIWRAVGDEVPYLTCASSHESHFEWRETKSQPEVEGEGLRRGPDGRVTEPVVPELIGVDFQQAAAGRLGGALGEVVAAHFPVYGRPPTCAGCRTAANPRRIQYHTPPHVVWPCVTAAKALGMMNLTASDVAITKE